MKKVVYICPQVKTCTTEIDPLLAGSVTGDDFLGYGGVDSEGTKDPDANDLNVWDDGSDWPDTHQDLFEE